MSHAVDGPARQDVIPGIGEGQCAGGWPDFRQQVTFDSDCHFFTRFLK
jgi:hypothetical protein